MVEDIYATKQSKLIGADIAFIVLSALFVVLRLLARHIARAGYWWDDYVIVVALVLAWIPATANLLATHYDFGKHVEVARPDATEKWYLCLYIFENFYAPAIAAVKFSILIFYYRIFTGHKPWFRWSLYAMGGIVFCWWIVCQFIVIFECTPIHYFWNRQPVNGHCIDIQKFFVGQAVPNIVTDFALLALPLPLIWKLHIPHGQKFALSGVFLLGSFVTAISIYRLTLLLKLTQVDITWNYCDAAVWSAAEPTLAVISACLPMLRPLVRLISPSSFSSQDRTRSYAKSGESRIGAMSKPSPHWRNSMDPIMGALEPKDDGTSIRIAQTPPKTGNNREEWEMQEGGRKGQTNSHENAPMEELGRTRLPSNVIHVRNEISRTVHDMT